MLARYPTNYLRLGEASKGEKACRSRTVGDPSHLSNYGDTTTNAHKGEDELPEEAAQQCDPPSQTERKEKVMSHDAVRPKGPAPLAKDISVRKPMKYLGTLLTTQTEEVSKGDGTKKRVTTVRRSVRR
jgi:hypothetical protein